MDRTTRILLVAIAIGLWANLGLFIFRPIPVTAQQKDVSEQLQLTEQHLGEQQATLGRYIDQIIGKVGSIHEDVQNLKSNVSGIQSDVGSVKSDVSDVHHDVRVIKSDLSDIQSELSNVKSDVGDVQGDVSSVKSDVFSIKSGTCLNRKIC